MILSNLEYLSIHSHVCVTYTEKKIFSNQQFNSFPFKSRPFFCFYFNLSALYFPFLLFSSRQRIDYFSTPDIIQRAPPCRPSEPAYIRGEKRSEQPRRAPIHRRGSKAVAGKETTVEASRPPY